MVDLSAITAGLSGTSQLTVGPEHTAPFVGSGRIAVLATPVMINVIEAAALNAIEHLLPAGHQSLGTHLDVSHVAATPVGLRVTATAMVCPCRAAPSPSR
jgi:fluoroacetyl-CoA thioesterase